MTDEQEAAWTEFSAELLRFHQAERAALGDVLEAEAEAEARDRTDASDNP